MSARNTALTTLIACRRQGAWSDGALKQNLARDRLDRRDAAFATRLVYGVLQNRMLLDFWLSRFVRGKLTSLEPAVLDILRLAVYQLRFLDRVPASAAVSEAVEQTKKYANARAAGLVNGVLRAMLRDPNAFPTPEDLPTRYSHPAALVELLSESVGSEKLEPLLACHNAIPAACVQVNTCRAETDAVCADLREEGFEVQPHPWLPDCLELSGGSPEDSRAYRGGLIYAQDPAARLAVLAAAPAPGMDVLDCCAAPGGKSFAAAICMENRGTLQSCDIHPHKINLIRRGAERLGLSCITAAEADASVPKPEWARRFDLVLADVPCSGLGVIRKKPDIRDKDLSALSALPEIQMKILAAQASHVKPGGVLLYSTCTVLKRENEDVAAAFAASHPAFRLEAFVLPGGISAPEGRCTLLPCDQGTDGFFIAKFRRES